MDRQTPAVTVVLPTYNEVDNLPRMVEALFKLDIAGLSIIVVDDNSPDGTGRIADELAAQHPGRISVIHRAGKLGLGTAYVAGFRRALADGADYVIQMDSDFSHSPAMLLTFLDLVRDCDLVIGSRYIRGGKLDERWSRWRRFLSWGGNIYARAITGLRIVDTTGGFRCFRASTLAGIDLGRVRSDGYAFQVEMAYLCQRKGYRMCEVPITFLERTHGKSKMSGKIIREAAWRVWQIRLRS